MLLHFGLAKDAVVRLSQSIKEEKGGTGAIWDTYNFTARPNSVYIYISKVNRRKKNIDTISNST